jgi:deoxyribose-phosphate aldolase
MPDLIEAAAAAPADADIAARVLPLVDLTSLGEDDTDAKVERLCDRALEIGVAAVCVWPRFVPLARKRLGTAPVRLATVANFPDGSDDVATAVRETRSARSWRAMSASSPSWSSSAAKRRPSRR